MSIKTFFHFSQFSRSRLIALSLVITLVQSLSLQVPAAAAQSIRLAVRSLGKNTVQVSCSLSASAAKNARQIEIGRAYGSATSFSVIARTKRRVRALRVNTKVAQAGEYRFLCRVVARNGKVGFSNGVRLIVRSPTVKPTPVPSKPSNQDRACSSSLTNQVVQLVNQTRASNGRVSLANNANLALAAQRHTSAMAKKQDLSHGTQAEMVQRIRDAGFTGSPVGENIAWGQTSAQAVMTDWMNSTGHRNNILDTRYRFIGVGCVIDRNGRYWWTQNFGG